MHTVLVDVSLSVGCLDVGDRSIPRPDQLPAEDTETHISTFEGWIDFTQGCETHSFSPRTI